MPQHLTNSEQRLIDGILFDTNAWTVVTPIGALVTLVCGAVLVIERNPKRLRDWAVWIPAGCLGHRQEQEHSFQTPRKAAMWLASQILADERLG